MKAWVVSIEHRHGTDVHLFQSKASADLQITEWVRCYWDEVSDLPDMPEEAPESDDEAVSLYFANHPDESYRLVECEVLP